MPCSNEWGWEILCLDNSANPKQIYLHHMFSKFSYSLYSPSWVVYVHIACVCISDCNINLNAAVVLPLLNFKFSISNNPTGVQFNSTMPKASRKGTPFSLPFCENEVCPNLWYLINTRVCMLITVKGSSALCFYFFSQISRSTISYSNLIWG